MEGGTGGVGRVGTVWEEVRGGKGGFEIEEVVGDGEGEVGGRVGEEGGGSGGALDVVMVD